MNEGVDAGINAGIIQHVLLVHLPSILHSYAMILNNTNGMQVYEHLYICIAYALISLVSIGSPARSRLSKYG